MNGNLSLGRGDRRSHHPRTGGDTCVTGQRRTVIHLHLPILISDKSGIPRALYVLSLHFDPKPVRRDACHALLSTFYERLSTVLQGTTAESQQEKKKTEPRAFLI